MLRNSSLLSGLDPDNEEDWPMMTERLECNKDADEWWILYFNGFCSIALKAIQDNDVRKAVWATSAAQRAKSMILFNNYFKDVVWMGHSAAKLINLLRLWEGNKDNNSEHFWQVQFRDHRFAFSQLFSVPVTFLAGQAFVGGMGVEHRDAKFVDFLLGGGSSKDAILVEIKVPGARLLGSKYRSVYRPSRELIGSLMQINDYRSSLTREFEVIARNSQHRFAIFNPKCIVIAGNFKQELGSDSSKKIIRVVSIIAFWH